MEILWREPWLKPLIDYDLDVEYCNKCKKKFTKISFVTSCEFCDIGIMHDSCANRHIIDKHHEMIIKKINQHKDKPLHEYQ